MICQGDKNEVLQKGKESSVETFISAISLHHDEVYERLFSEISDRKDLELFWHSSCYSSYTSQQNIRYATGSNVSAPLLTEDSGNTEDRRLSRSAIAPTDWSCCLFCCNKTHKKVREMQSVSQAPDLLRKRWRVTVSRKISRVSREHQQRLSI